MSAGLLCRWTKSLYDDDDDDDDVRTHVHVNTLVQCSVRTHVHVNTLVQCSVRTHVHVNTLISLTRQCTRITLRCDRSLSLITRRALRCPSMNLLPEYEEVRSKNILITMEGLEFNIIHSITMVTWLSLFNSSLSDSLMFTSSVDCFCSQIIFLFLF